VVNVRMIDTLVNTLEFVDFTHMLTICFSIIQRREHAITIHTYFHKKFYAFCEIDNIDLLKYHIKIFNGIIFFLYESHPIQDKSLKLIKAMVS
jgi:hypothetical protein